MADAKKYHVETARDDLQSLDEVLQHIATRKDHVRIVSITWQPSRASVAGDELPAGYTDELPAGYTIVSENAPPT